MTSPIQMASAGPKITPYSATQAGGGAALPPYLQARRPTSAIQAPGANPNPTYSGQPTQPIITPKSTAVPGEVKTPTPTPVSPSPAMSPAQIQAKASASAVPQSPPPQAGGNNLNDVYNFFKSDLQNQTKQALANTTADASARGVYYGTPLTGSEADINTQYLRGLGQLQSGMYGNEQQNELARLGLASSLGWQASQNAPPMGNNNDFFSTLGGLFGPQVQQPTVSAPRPGPAGTPNNVGQQTGIDPLTGQPKRL